jgi:hypothetical protein
MKDALAQRLTKASLKAWPAKNLTPANSASSENPAHSDQLQKPTLRAGFE